MKEGCGPPQLTQHTSSVQSPSCIVFPHLPHMSTLDLQVVAPCPNLWHLKHLLDLGMYILTGQLVQPILILSGSFVVPKVRMYTGIGMLALFSFFLFSW